MRCDVAPMGLRAVCPIEGCEYVAFGDDEKQLKKDLRYHLMDIHHCNQIPEGVEMMEEDLMS
jgi:predicted small metal-binding protein